MKEIIFTNPNRPKSMPDGVWSSEPDKVQWLDKETNLPCLARRGGGGAWCGYVGVDNKHSLYGKHHDDIRLEFPYQKHGGLSFSGKCQEREGGICHVVEAGENDDVWWLGFACVAEGDAAPFWDGSMETVMMNFVGDDSGYPYRTLEYTRAETVELAKILKDYIN